MAVKLRIKYKKRKLKSKKRQKQKQHKTYKRKIRKGGGCGCSSKLNPFSGGSKVSALMGHEITGVPLNLQQTNLMPETSNTGFHFQPPAMEGGRKRRNKRRSKRKRSKRLSKRLSNRRLKRKTAKRKRKGRKHRKRLRKQQGGGLLSTIGLGDINYGIYGAENALQSSYNVLKGDSPVVSADIMKGQYAHN